MDQPDHKQQPAFTPASFEKRAAAWMGLAYVLMVLFVITFSIYTGKNLPGAFPLFLLPVAVAGMVLAIHRQRKGTAPGGMPLTVIIVLLCLAAIVLGLLLGVPAVVHAVQTAYA